MVVYCVYKECRFVGGEGYPDPLMVSSHRADVRADIVDRLCSEFKGMFSRKPWPEVAKVDSVYSVPAEASLPEPTWIAGIVEESFAEGSEDSKEKEITNGPS
jgi:hypothetical protein